MMADVVSIVIRHLLLPIVIVFLVYKLTKPFLVMCHGLVYAWIIDRDRIGFNKAYANRKQELFSGMATSSIMRPNTRSETKDIINKCLTVLEVGAGSGANFQFYPKGTSVICVDPNPYFESYLKTRSHEFPHVTLKEFIVACGENMNMVPDESVDAVVCTVVLCTVRDQKKVLQNILRVLKRGGTFYFIEHVADESSTLRYTFQCLVTPLLPFIGDDCHLNRKSWECIDDAGFSNVQYERFYGEKGPWLVRPLLFGTAVK